MFHYRDGISRFFAQQGTSVLGTAIAEEPNVHDINDVIGCVPCYHAIHGIKAVEFHGDIYYHLQQSNKESLVIEGHKDAIPLIVGIPRCCAAKTS